MSRFLRDFLLRSTLVAFSSGLLVSLRLDAACDPKLFGYSVYETVWINGNRTRTQGQPITSLPATRDYTNFMSAIFFHINVSYATNDSFMCWSQLTPDLSPFPQYPDPSWPQVGPHGFPEVITFDPAPHVVRYYFSASDNRSDTPRMFKFENAWGDVVLTVRQDGLRDGARLDLLDPVSSLLSANSLTTNTEVLATHHQLVKGVATDGVARLVLRFNASLAGTATFSLVDSNGQSLAANDENGSVQNLQGLQTGNSVTGSTASTSQGNKAFAVFVAPSQFVRSTVPNDVSASQRQVFIAVQFTPTGGQPSDASTVPVTLIRPLVVLVHGVWSSPETWDNFGELRAVGPRFTAVKRVDYGMTSAFGFDVNAPKVYSQLTEFITRFKETANVAAVQADLVSHSMGAPVIRTMALAPTFRYDPGFPTFGQGPVRKLITIAGVHQGSHLADDLISDPCLQGLLGGWPFYRDILHGAVLDMRTTSAAVQAINSTPTPFPVHTIVGIADQSAIQFWQGALNAVGSVRACWNHFDFGALFSGRNHDLLVSDTSQKGFTNSATATDSVTGVVHSPPFDRPVSTGTPETSDSRISTLVTMLLDKNANDRTYFAPIPY